MAWWPKSSSASNSTCKPIRVESYDWPKTPGAKPDVLGIFTYTKLKVNVGLTDADFDAQRLHDVAQ